MKLNNKGFMLAEVIITSVTVMVALVALYGTFSKLYVKFEDSNNYDHVDAMYAARGLYELLISKPSNSTNNINKLIEVVEGTESEGYKTIFPESNDKLEKFMNSYQIMQAYLSKYDSNSLYNEDNEGVYSDSNIQEEFKGYVKYLSNNLDFADYRYSYILVVELSDSNDCNTSINNCQEDNANNYFGYFLIP